MDITSGQNKNSKYEYKYVKITEILLLQHVSSNDLLAKSPKPLKENEKR